MKFLPNRFLKHTTYSHLTRSLLALVCAVALLSVGPLAAEDVNHTEAQVKVWIPDGWEQEADDDSLIVGDPNEEVMVAFLVVEGDNVEAALDAMEAELSEIVDDVAPDGEASEIDLNGMPAVVMDAKGSVEGEPVDLGIAVIMTPANKALLVFAIAQSSAVEKHEKTIEKILGGIKPLK
ncbi:MAG: hypothetical protein NXI24_07820 [bacterium]|nr:hypothetical protein [bacterium]